MPNNMQNVSRTKLKKEKKNERVEANALTDKDARFGRAIKALGNGMFRVIISEKDHIERLMEVTARVGGRSVARIQINDIVVVAESGSVYELLGSITRKSALLLQKEKRIHPGLLTETSGEEGEDQIQFDEDTIDPEEEVNVDDI
jgi:translation initiation factor IF-1